VLSLFKDLGCILFHCNSDLENMLNACWTWLFVERVNRSRKRASQSRAFYLEGRNFFYKQTLKVEINEAAYIIDIFEMDWQGMKKLTVTHDGQMKIGSEIKLSLW